jgi:glycosyltransferase involved in cell wall biosynthesis
MPPTDAGIVVHPVAGTWSRSDLARVDASLDEQPEPRCLLVQWVPHAFGHRSLNVRFCAWVRSRARRKGDRVDVVVHEAFHAFGEGSWRQDVAAAVHRVMVTLLLQRATKAWVTIPAWADRLRRYGRSVSFCWLPVPSNIPVSADPAAVHALRAGFPEGTRIVGHFSTYNTDTRRDLDVILPAILTDASLAVLLIGRGSERFLAEFVGRHAALAPRVRATGSVDVLALSHALQASDVLAQPYIDGASTRRTTLMAALEHGAPTVTNLGRLSDPTWSESSAVVAVPAGDRGAFVSAVIGLSHDAARRAALSASGRALYAQRFAVSRAIDSLVTDDCQGA